jgi:hypothetical protein
MGNLTDIADRLTPSAPIELTFGAQPIATGRKFAQLFGHMAASGSTVLPYSVYTVINVGNAAMAQAEVDALAGAGSQAGKMAFAFVNANQIGGTGNFPAFRICFLANGDLHFGSSNQAITAVQGLRCDFLVSCYPTDDTTNKATLLALATLLSGIDRDLTGQFGSFVSLASVEPLDTQIAFADNSRLLVELPFPDSNTAAVDTTGNLTVGAQADIIEGLATVVGIYPGAEVSGTGIPADTVVEQILDNQSVMISNAATIAGTDVALVFQNVISQPPEILASAQAAVLLGLAFPYIPVEGITLGGIIPAKVPSDQIIIDPSGSSEAALQAGLSPTYVQPGGTVGLIRSVTSFTTLTGPGDIRATAYFDWQDLVLMNDFKEDVFQITQNPPFNNNPGGTKASQFTANLLKDEILREALDYEDLGAFQGVKANAPLFIVQNSTTSRGRFDFKIPVNVIPGLMVIAGNIEGVSGADFGDFSL